MKQTRRFLIVASISIAIWLAFECIVGIVAAEMALHPGRKVEGPQSEQIAQAIASRHNAQMAEVSITAPDGAALRAWSFRPAHGNGDAVILLHGHTDNRAGMLGNADLLLRHGYSVLLPDARAHGLSGGNLATYGVNEADDIRRWFDWLEQADAPGCIDGLGESMGAAQLLQSLRVTPGFCAVVAESLFASFRDASYDRMGEQLHAGADIGRTLMRPAVEAGFLYSRWKYGVDLEQASPENAVAASKVPVLLIHGKRDTNLPPRHSEVILTQSSARGSEVVLWEPSEAGHCGAAGAEPEEYERRVIGWFEEHRPSKPGD
jgi:hypothetical protein